MLPSYRTVTWLRLLSHFKTNHFFISKLTVLKSEMLIGWKISFSSELTSYGAWIFHKYFAFCGGIFGHVKEIVVNQRGVVFLALVRMLDDKYF
jgi:hypothetical protein